MNDPLQKCPRILKGAFACEGTLEVTKNRAGVVIALHCRRCQCTLAPDDDRLVRRVSEVRR